MAVVDANLLQSKTKLARRTLEVSKTYSCNTIRVHMVAIGSRPSKSPYQEHCRCWQVP
jgi:hypothetical protein